MGIKLANPATRLVDERSGQARQGLRKVQTYRAGVEGVLVNIISAKAQGDGWLEAWGGGAQPDTSSLNYRANEDNNMVLMVPTAADGSIQIFTSSLTQIIVDLRGTLERDNYISGEA